MAGVAGTLRKDSLRLRGGILKCANDGCENKCMLLDEPQVAILQIPFLKGIEVQVWNWNRKTEAQYCEECMIEKENNKHDDAFDEAGRIGFDEGYEVARKEFVGLG